MSTGSTDHEFSRAEKLARIAALGIDPWGGRFDGHQPIAKIRELPCPPFDDNPTERVRAAGRIVLRRLMGKIHFLQLRDQTGDVQVMLGQKQVGEVGWQVAQELDLGDLVGAEGIYGKTRTGEPTIRADKLTFLSKSLEPHPDKHAGIKDEEFRVRHRYLDLVYNPDSLRRTMQRVAVVRAIRSYLDGQGFMDVETPTLHAIAGGAAARPFVTHHNALDIDLYLRIALELHLKRLLVGGLERVYEIGRVFRNEGISRRHNPEFTMLELYQAYGDYHSMMDLTEGMIVAAIDAVNGNRRRRYGDRTFDFTPPWPRAKYADLFREHVGIPIDADDTLLTETAKERGVEVIGRHRDVVVHALFEHSVEPAAAKSDQPVFVYDYPATLCPLTKRKAGDPAIAERFELYVAGMELANAYTELNDPVMQEATFRQQLAGMPADESMAKMDEDFVRALRHGMPPAGGLGVGIDRLVMLLTDTPTIRDVILFPLLRPGGSVTSTDAINLDTSGATSFVAESSPVRGLLKAYVQGKSMLMCMSARAEFLDAVAKRAGSRERARANRFLYRVTFVRDNPSARVLALRGTKAIRDPDRIIFGTGDALGVVTVTSDGRFVRAAAGQSLILAVFLHPPGRFRGQ